MKKVINLLIVCFSFGATFAQKEEKMVQNIQLAKGEVIQKGKLIYSEIRINATPEKVWEIFTNFEKYPEWNPFIKSLKGNPNTDSKINVFLQPQNNKGMNFSPNVLKFDTNKEFRWIGKLFIPRLFDGEHTFLLIDNHDGTTTFLQFERFRGILIPLMKKMLEIDTLNSFKSMNEAFKIRCEEQ
jgi:hypothetical protein